MRDLEKLGVDVGKTTLEEDLAWWSVINFWSFVCGYVASFDAGVNRYFDRMFINRIPNWMDASYAGSVTMPMLRTNTGKIVEELAVQFVGKK